MGVFLFFSQGNSLLPSGMRAGVPCGTPGLGTQPGGQQSMSTSPASTMAVLGQAGDLFRQWQIKACAHSRAMRKEVDVCASALTESQCGEERAFAF